MRIEHSAIIKQIQEERLGNVTFSRYDLATGVETIEQVDTLLKESLQFLLLCHQSEIETIYGSHEERHQIYLITLQFKDHSLCNLFINASPTNQKNYQKQIEIVGTQGLYQYNSADQRGFASNFISPGNYQPDYQETSLENISLSNLIFQIKQSIKNNETITFGG